MRVEPSGRSFEVGPHESLLEAGLRAGFALPHRCANGTCGECRARLCAGAMGETLFHDYRFTEAEKLQGWVLLCSSRAASDLVIEVREAGIADIPQQFLTLKLGKLEYPREDVAIVHARTPRSQTLQFLAGQSVELQADGLAPVRRAVASCPCDGLHLQFHLRRCPEDPTASALFDALPSLRQMRLSGPYGACTYDEQAGRPVLFVAYETGFAQAKSLIEHIVSLETDTPMCLIWLGRGRHYMANLCRSWDDALDEFSSRLFEFGAELSDPGADLLRVLETVWCEVDRLEQHAVYLFLPDAARQATTVALRARGVAQQHIHSDPA